ncbi:MAG TPA: hypothetical protein VK957_11080 [Lunatimonas sp.]|nr:hypothetical protein [Lunatimonas sp.]
MNKNLKFLPIIGITLTLLGYFYLTYQTYQLNERRNTLDMEISELESIKMRLTNEVKIKDTLITLQDNIISQSSDEETVQQGAELKRRMNEPSSEFFSITAKEDIDVDQALKFEREGFNYLLEKDVTNAISSFRKSENSYNGFHNVYGIAVYLERNRSNLSENNAEEWIEIYRTILKDYSWKMPSDIKMRLIEITQ